MVRTSLWQPEVEARVQICPVAAATAMSGQISHFAPLGAITLAFAASRLNPSSCCPVARSGYSPVTMQRQRLRSRSPCSPFRRRATSRSRPLNVIGLDRIQQFTALSNRRSGRTVRRMAAALFVTSAGRTWIERLRSHRQQDLGPSVQPVWKQLRAAAARHRARKARPAASRATLSLWRERFCSGSRTPRLHMCV